MLRHCKFILEFAFILFFLVNSLFLLNCEEQSKNWEDEPKLAIASQEKRDSKILVVNNNLNKMNSQKTIDIFVSRLKSIYPADYVVLHWSEYSVQIVNALKADLIILSPQSKPWQKYPQKDFERFKEELRNTRLPMIGICGGHQLIALFLGGKLHPIEPRGAKCQYPNSYENCKREKGFIKISFIQDPVFDGIEGTAIVWLNHVEEVKNAPEGFKIIAFNDTTKIQAMKSNDGRYYGFQFHPEYIDVRYKDGAIILKNVINLVLNSKNSTVQ